MVVNIRDQVCSRSTLPLKCGEVYSGSPLPIAVIGVPRLRGGLLVTGVTVEVVNAAGVPVEASCDCRRGIYRTLFSAANFAVYGFISKGLRVKLVLENGEIETIGVGDFEVKASGADAVKGDASAQYVKKGGDVYLPSTVDDAGVQHYVKQTMAYDAEIGWGAIWGGDYILSVEGEFVSVV